MSDPDRLNVWHEQRLVGELWRNQIGAIGFRYAPEWSAGSGFAVSHSLPLADREFAPEEGTNRPGARSIRGTIRRLSSAATHRENCHHPVPA